MELCLNSPLDMHLHLRDAAMMKLVAPLSSNFAGAVIMPNLVPAITHAPAMLAYHERVMKAIQTQNFTPLMTLFLTPLEEKDIDAAQATPHFFAFKLYPSGITTNSDGGCSHIDQVRRTLSIMQERDIPLLVHGESHGFVMDRESEFLSIYRQLAQEFPRLKISMEHITTAAAVDLLDEFENLYATVTLQHLLITLDDVAGGALQPHLFCKPIAKRPEDRDRLLNAALSGHPRLMFGSDSAPHPRCKKEACGCAAGVFTAPVALPKLAEVFTKHNAGDKLQDFISGNAQAIYKITPQPKKVILHDVPMQVPAKYQSFGEEVVPMFAGESLAWSVKEVL